MEVDGTLLLFQMIFNANELDEESRCVVLGKTTNFGGGVIN